jgi:Tol biopolymer transport system component
LFASTGEPDRAGIWIGTLDGAAPFRILERATQAAYAQGDLLFIRDGVLVAQAFDVALGQLTGEAQAIRGTAVGEAGQFSVSEAGVMAYASGVNPDYQFVWIDRNGRELAKVLQPARWGNFDLSPDGSRLITSKGDALTGASGNGDIWSIDLARGVETRLTFGDALDGSPLWSPDGRRIAFTRAFASPRTECHAVLMPAAGGDEVVAHDAKEGGCVILDDWSPDGRFLSFNRDPSLMALPLTGDRKPWSFVRTSSASVDESHFSPDSKWIAYSSNESGVWQVYLAPFPPKGERWQISADGGVEARWRTDARELYYLRLDGRMMAVNIRLAPTPELGEARVLFDSGVTVTVRGVNYAVSNDGQRFLMRRQVINGQLPLNVVLNWGAESESVYP